MTKKLIEQADKLRGLAVAPLFGPIDQPAPVADQRTLHLANASYEAASALQGALQAKRDIASKANRKNAAKPRKTISEAQLIDALEAHVTRCGITGRHPAAKGWKGSIAHYLKIDPRTLRYPPDWDEPRIVGYLESR